MCVWNVCLLMLVCIEKEFFVFYYVGLIFINSAWFAVINNVRMIHSVAPDRVGVYALVSQDDDAGRSN